MTITEHKTLIAAIPEDLTEGEEIEVSNNGKKWVSIQFKRYSKIGKIVTCGIAWKYARRPAAAHKKAEKTWNEKVVDFLSRLSRQPDSKPDYWSSCSQCDQSKDEAEDLLSNWQNSLERRPNEALR